MLQLANSLKALCSICIQQDVSPVGRVMTPVEVIPSPSNWSTLGASSSR